MDTTEAKELVRNWYGSVAAGAKSCCGSDAAPRDASCNMGYSEAELATLPEGADLGLGCGNPQALAALRRGEVVVDLGSGAGIDCFLAARQVGATGRVIGVDMTHEMLAKARANAARVGAANVEFRLGEIEHLPIADNTADVVISNCVINLVPDKAQVYREAFRVLKPAGRIAIADVVNTAPLPPDLASDATLICTCLAGAATIHEIEDWLAAAGFTDIRITVKPGSRELVASWAPGRGIEEYVASATIEARKPNGLSLLVPRMFSDPDGECRFDFYPEPFALQQAAPPAAPFYTAQVRKATSYMFFRIPPGWVGDLHPTPNPRMVICLSGILRFTGSDGKSFTMVAGSRMFDINTTGKGHVTEVISDVPVEGVIIRVD